LFGEPATVTYRKLHMAYGEHSPSRAQVFRWHKSFLEGREQVKTNLVREDLQPQKRTTIWKEWGLLWGQIVDWRWEWSV